VETWVHQLSYSKSAERPFDPYASKSRCNEAFGSACAPRRCSRAAGAHPKLGERSSIANPTRGGGDRTELRPPPRCFLAGYGYVSLDLTRPPRVRTCPIMSPARAHRIRARRGPHVHRGRRWWSEWGPAPRMEVVEDSIDNSLDKLPARIRRAGRLPDRRSWTAGELVG
jgi:hypothetical protein